MYLARFSQCCIVAVVLWHLYFVFILGFLLQQAAGVNISSVFIEPDGIDRTSGMIPSWVIVIIATLVAAVIIILLVCLIKKK